jgi:outer membrane protein TolC
MAAAAAAATAGAAAGRREARAEWLPQVTTSGSFTRFEEPMVVRPLHALDAAQLFFDRTLVQGDVRLAWTVFDGGRRIAEGRAAAASLAARSAAEAATDGDVLVEVASRYLAALTSAAVLEAQQDGLRALRTERDRVAQLVRQGAVAQVEQLRVEAAVAAAEAEVAQADADRDVALRELARTLALDSVVPASLHDVVPRGPEPAPRDALAAGLEARSPDLTEAESALSAAHETRRRAQAAWLPRLDVQGAVVAYGDGSWNFSPEWQVGARLFYPVFLGGQRSASIDRAEAAEAAAKAQVAVVRDRLNDALDRALAVRTAAAARVTALDASVRHLTEVARIENLSLSAGAGVEAEYLRAEADARRGRAQLAQARAARVLADVQLARVTGDLTVTWLSDNLENVP